MTEHDNTNRGAAFTPYPEQKFILSGRINYHGADRNVALITGETKDGKKKIEVYQKIGIMFENDRKPANYILWLPNLLLELYNFYIQGY